MNEREQKSFIRLLAAELKTYCREVLTYQLLVAVLKKNGVAEIDETLAQLRHSEAVQKKLNEQFAGVEEILPTADEASPDREIEALLARWKANGPPN